MYRAWNVFNVLPNGRNSNAPIASVCGLSLRSHWLLIGGTGKLLPKWRPTSFEAGFAVLCRRWSDKLVKFRRKKDRMAYVSNRLVEMLDHIERRVELMREQAVAMEQERDCLLEMIQEVKKNRDLNCVSLGEREEIEVNAERLMMRCLTVEVQVSTPRNPIQETALVLVNKCIDDLVSRLKTDLSGSKTVCQSFLNSCLPEAKGPIDQRFQASVIDCAADDQKKTRKRLESLLRTIEHAEKNTR